MCLTIGGSRRVVLKGCKVHLLTGFAFVMWFFGDWFALVLLKDKLWVDRSSEDFCCLLNYTKLFEQTLIYRNLIWKVSSHSNIASTVLPVTFLERLTDSSTYLKLIAAAGCMWDSSAPKQQSSSPLKTKSGATCYAMLCTRSTTHQLRQLSLAALIFRSNTLLEFSHWPTSSRWRQIYFWPVAYFWPWVKATPNSAGFVDSVDFSMVLLTCFVTMLWDRWPISCPILECPIFSAGINIKVNNSGPMEWAIPEIRPPKSLKQLELTNFIQMTVVEMIKTRDSCAFLTANFALQVRPKKSKKDPKIPPNALETQRITLVLIDLAYLSKKQIISSANWFLVFHIISCEKPWRIFRHISSSI